MLACPACSHTAPRTTQPWMAPPTISVGLPHQSLTENMGYRLVCRPISGRHFLKSLFSQIHLSWCQVEKTQPAHSHFNRKLIPHPPEVTNCQWLLSWVKARESLPIAIHFYTKTEFIQRSIFWLCVTQFLELVWFYCFAFVFVFLRQLA